MQAMTEEPETLDARYGCGTGRAATYHHLFIELFHEAELIARFLQGADHQLPCSRRNVSVDAAMRCHSRAKPGLSLEFHELIRIWQATPLF